MVRQVDPETGNKLINRYMILTEIGRGVYGKVKLCVDMESGEQYVR
jgi:serine/threonine protein kinase